MSEPVEKSQTSENEIVVYLDSHRIYRKGCKDLYIDFRTSKDFLLFQQFLEGGLAQSDSSYIHLKYVKIKQRLKYDTYYRLNIDELKRLKSKNDLSFIIEDDSYVIGAHYIFSKNAEYDEILQKCTQSEEYEFEMEEFDNNRENCIDFRTEVELTQNPVKVPSLYVADVGQANWNELRDDDKTVLVFDCGSPLNCRRKKTDEIWDNHKLRLKKSPSTLVISHWDIDHYHCLVNRNERFVSYFTVVFCPLPKSKTSRKVFGKLKKAFGNNFVFIPRFGGMSNRSSWPPMKLEKRSHNLSLYAGDDSDNINLCGLAIFVDGPNKTGLFSGDLSLGQCNEVMMNENNTKPHVLIVPHHGGYCGQTSLQIMNPIDLAIISVGANNSYKHPNRDVLKCLRKISKNGIKRTDMNGSIIEKL